MKTYIEAALGGFLATLVAESTSYGSAYFTSRWFPDKGSAASFLKSEKHAARPHPIS